VLVRLFMSSRGINASGMISFVCGSIQLSIPGTPSSILLFFLGQIIQIEDDSDHETATRADRDVLAIPEICDVDLETVATWTGVVVDLQCLVECHILNFNLIIDIELVGGILLGLRGVRRGRKGSGRCGGGDRCCSHGVSKGPKIDFSRA
jgi:hypothetical protein